MFWRQRTLKWRPLSILLLFVLLAGGSLSARAEGFGVSEIRAGAFSHNVYSGFVPVLPQRWNGISRIEDLNVELLFNSPDLELFRWIGSPRPNLGGTFSLTGQESMAHLALTWQLPLFDTPVFFESSFGAAINNGDLTGAAPPRRNLGCRVNFYESISVGVNMEKNFTALLTYEHTSNLGLCVANEGLSNLGLRIGYKF